MVQEATRALKTSIIKIMSCVAARSHVGYKRHKTRRAGHVELQREREKTRDYGQGNLGMRSTRITDPIIDGEHCPGHMRRSAIESMEFSADVFDTALLAKESISAHGVSNITQ